MAADVERRVSLVFAVNGERFELSKVEPSITLLEFLRTRTRYTGTKLGCGEGGCGACVVLLSSYNSATEEVTDFSVSSCLTLLCSIHHCSITTTEGLGNSRDGPHSIHERFAGFHASQCGFCTPGMCMSLFSGLVNADKTRRPVAREGFSKIMVSEAEKSIAGNLCRCTGYRPIVDACKSFAADVDLEDLGLNTFRKKGEMGLDANRLPTYIQDGVHTFPDFLKSEIKSSSNCSSRSFGRDPISITTAQLDSLSWYRPASIDELYYLLNSESVSCTSYKMVVGNTGSGLYKDWDLGYKYIDLRGIPELTVIRRDDRGIEFGAAVTISKAIQVLEEENDKRPVFYKLADHMNKIASHFVRNTASLGGNLIMAQWKHFPSDLATVLLAVDASVTIQMPSERLVLTLEEFLEMSPCDHKTILLSIYIPSWKSVIKTSSNTDNLIDSVNRENSGILFETYRASPRPLGNFVAYLNSAFLARISSDEASGDPVLHYIRLAFGAYGVPHAIRAKKVEIFLTGKPITASVLLGAIRLLREIIIPEEGTSHREYRSSLAVAFLFSFLQPVTKGLAVPTKILGVEIRNGTGNAEYTNADTNRDVNNNDMLLSSTQTVEYSTEYYPVGEPTKKVGAVLQASGEAVYVDDIPSPKDCLYGAFIYSTKPLAHIKGIKFKPTLASEKIITVISVNDIPNGGKNIGSSSLFGSEPLFANTHTEYAGQPLGVVIAETQRFANIGARQVIVDYTKHLESPILSVDNAVKRSSFFLAPPFLIPKQIGDFSEGMAEADIKINSAEIKLGSQYYFYMETQTSLAIPDEDDCMVVYSSSQCPENTQSVISQCLGIPAHNVRVITRRVGGGFGGKALRSLPIAAACALAAHKLRRPVRMYLDRQTDMVMTGGRHPVEVIYTVGFKSDGKITALKLDMLVNSGISEDISPVMPHNIIEALKKYNWGALSFDVKICKTNLTSKSAMRAPGELQGSYIAEAIIENVASSLGIDVNFVRKRNLHTFDSLVLFYEGSAGEAYEYTLPSIFDKLASFSVYNRRAEMTRNFNIMNKWRKRGISCVPIVHKVTVFGKPGKVSVLPDGSVVVEVGGVELGQGLWTKVKQMAAFALGQLWGDGSQDLLDRVRVIQVDTLSLVQGGFTSGSTTSEASCEAARLACKILVDRLKPLKDSLQEQMDLVTWDSLIAQATLQSVNLQASSYWVPDSSSSEYLNYGAAISEVEVDLFTGATTILRTDLIYDCGQSLNPAVDLGQIEGAFVQGIGFFMYEEYLSNSDGLVVSDGTWTYKIPTVDTIPKQFNVELLNSGNHQKRVLSSKASGEPPLLLAASVHCATREAIRAARSERTTSQDGSEGHPLHFQLGVPATMPVVKELCGLDNVERFLEML